MKLNKDLAIYMTHFVSSEHTVNMELLLKMIHAFSRNHSGEWWPCDMLNFFPKLRNVCLIGHKYRTRLINKKRVSHAKTGVKIAHKSKKI